MGEVNDLLLSARWYFDEVLRYSRAMLERGRHPVRVHRRFVSAAFELREEAELRALVVESGDHGGLDRLAALVRELETLAAEAKLEAGRQGGADAEF